MLELNGVRDLLLLLSFISVSISSFGGLFFTENRSLALNGRVAKEDWALFWSIFFGSVFLRLTPKLN